MVFLISSIAVLAQDNPGKRIIKDLVVTDSILQIDSLSLSPYDFKIFNNQNIEIGPSLYSVDFSRAQLHIKASLDKFPKEIRVQYTLLPDFITKKYSALDPRIISDKTVDMMSLYYPEKSKGQVNELFGGINSSGSLSRSITVGNNQDAVVNSNFNLQLDGELSKNVSIRASITDNNIPLSEGGYSQRIQDFDRIYLEIFSKDWTLQGGDINLTNSRNYFMKFSKKITGLYMGAKLEPGFGETDFFISGGVVRGSFSTYKFNGTEGNQGPYKITGENSEQVFYILSGSETVYANGVPLKRGDNNDYMIDYTNGEILFTPLFPVNANMRFTIDYQIAENSYTRFITYDGVNVSNEKLDISVSYYNETDSKSRPVEQDLTELQQNILSEAGDNKLKMISPSEVPAEYESNKILYKKNLVNGAAVYEYSNDPAQELYEIRFSLVGKNKGDYEIVTTLAAGRVFAYVPQLDGKKQGSYAPLIQLIAPESYQIADISADYQPNDRIELNAELALSVFDQNLFSDLDDDNNNGFASKILYEHLLVDKVWDLRGNVNFEYIADNFRTIERYRNIEFLRDWNLIDPLLFLQQDQQFAGAGLAFSDKKESRLLYRFENLRFNEAYQGTRNTLSGTYLRKNTRVDLDANLLNSDTRVDETNFLRSFLALKQNAGKGWVGARTAFERNEIEDKVSGNLNLLSHQLFDIDGFTGLGDSTKTFAEIGYRYQKTDSVRYNDLTNFNQANTYYARFKMEPFKDGTFLLNANYRKVNNVFADDEESINGRFTYNQALIKNMVNFNMNYQTRSGVLPQQDFSYAEVEPGKGFYSWIDFNNNGIQELDEFVVAAFPDEAIYVKILLPTVVYIKSHENRFSQAINLQATAWRNRTGLKKILSHFSDQAYFLVQANEKRDKGSINLNPMAYDEGELLSLDQQIRNSLFFNRGLQKFSTGYLFSKNRKKTFFAVDNQDVSIRSHELTFSHRINSFWLFDLNTALSNTESESSVFSNRNYELETYELSPKISFFLDRNLRFDSSYTFKDKENTISAFETLDMHKLSLGGQYSNENKITVLGNFGYILNSFEGSVNSVVGYQMLEGFQPGMNLTWNLSMQKRFLTYLDLNFNYTGRKSETSNTIHTGTVQVRASF